MAVSNAKLNAILASDLQEQLAGSGATLLMSITDLSSRAVQGMDRLSVPRESGLALDTVVSGNSSTTSTYTVDMDVILLDQPKQVAEYINWANEMDSTVDVEAAFFEGAPKIYREGIEAYIDTFLGTASAEDFESTASGAGNFNIADIGKAKKLLDKNKVPKNDRFLAVDADGMEILAATQEFQDGSKSLSPEALREGIVSRVKGFNVIQSEDVAAGKVRCYHKSAVAFAAHQEVQGIVKPLEHEARKFIAMRGKFGAVDLDNDSNNGILKLTISTAS